MDISKLSDGKVKAIKALETDIIEASKAIARHQRTIRESREGIRVLLGTSIPATYRPWQWLRDRLLMEAKPLPEATAVEILRTFQEERNSKDPAGDAKRSLNKAKNQFKILNGLIGLAEWGDEKFTE